jgi:phosphoglycerate kinase
MVPVAVIISRSYNDNFNEHVGIDKIEEDESVYDIAFKTINKYKEVINSSETIFVNGTAGKYEDIKFATGTRELLQAIANSPATKIVGGGDGVSAVKKFRLEDKFTFLSTGGGATLEYIINEGLPAIDNISDV